MLIMPLNRISGDIFSHSKYIRVKKIEHCVLIKWSHYFISIAILSGKYSYLNFTFKETDSFIFFFFLVNGLREIKKCTCSWAHKLEGEIFRI